MNFIEKIIEEKKLKIFKAKKIVPLEDLMVSQVYKIETRDFKKAISGRNTKIIAEIKKASPSKGILIEDFDVNKIASIYESSSCDAISVLTEESYFKGSPEYIKIVKNLTSKPILRKDFIIDEYQIFESKMIGADAILLISSILSTKVLNSFVRIAKDLDLDCLVEVHNIEDLEKTLETEAQIIGINNRNLKTFEVSLQTSMELSGKIPSNIVKVSESGINNENDIKLLNNYNIRAFLIGESIIKNDNPEKFINQLKKGVKD